MYLLFHMYIVCVHKQDEVYIEIEVQENERKLFKIAVNYYEIK